MRKSHTPLMNVTFIVHKSPLAAVVKTSDTLRSKFGDGGSLLKVCEHIVDEQIPALEALVVDARTAVGMIVFVHFSALLDVLAEKLDGRLGKLARLLIEAVIFESSVAHIVCVYPYRAEPAGGVARFADPVHFFKF